MSSIAPTLPQLIAAILFGLAVLHTFSTRTFEHMAHLQPRHAGLWHLLAEVEVVFGFWALVLVVFLATHDGVEHAMQYLEAQSFREPAFIFVIMVIAASRPILDFSGALLSGFSRLIPIPRPAAYYLTILSVGPLLGSFITEPAAMTLSAMLLRQSFMNSAAPSRFKYATIGVLFVNVSIGGTLTPFAAPPVLMVADRWSWDIAFMLQNFGWKAFLAVAINAAAVTFLVRHHLGAQGQRPGARQEKLETPWPLIAVHLAFLAAVVVAGHYPVVFIGLFLFFLGIVQAYPKHQGRLILREGLLVAFFLGGLVVLGSLQEWWLQPLLAGMNSTALFYGAALLTAITDNAALTYLGSLVEGLSPESKYALVAGAVTGGGLTVIANAPNPAGYSILKGAFDEGVVSAFWLAVAAVPPTLVAVAAFQLLP
jgi:hypothetical protein